ncbi:MAG: TonB-dependent siderophore myxochelin receptor MxcH [Myxococcales bacterium]
MATLVVFSSAAGLAQESPLEPAPTDASASDADAGAVPAPALVDDSREVDAAVPGGEPAPSEPVAPFEPALPPEVVPPDPPLAPPAPVAPPQSDSGAAYQETTKLEVTVRGRSKAETARRSAEAVHVVETAQAQRQSADLGEVLARTQGVGVQRAGGLGSDTRFSLNGLTDDQVRFYLDGVPLEFTGYPFGIANVPVNLVERVEIYRGVVPIRFGADALGGAVNLVSDERVRGTHASGSYQLGSFGTQRLTASARHLHEPSGWFTRVNGFFDSADNNYPMNIEIADAQGRERLTRVYRFHDGYRAGGANLETGVVGKPWAERLLVRGFFTQYDKQIQHNLLMTFSPYGDVDLKELSGGATLRYENTFARGVTLNAVAGYARRLTHYRDLGDCVYDWFGQCLRMRPQPGERVGRAQDQLYEENGVYGRATLAWKLSTVHALRASLSPTLTGRDGDERREVNPAARDPLDVERHLYGLVSGLEYQSSLLGGRLENALFAKDYLQVLRSEDPLSNGLIRRQDRATHRFGWGDSLRYAWADWIYAKSSYEWATRLPRADEIFGNAFPVGPNLKLAPEVSHNVNLGLNVDARDTRAGQLRANVNGFLRKADDLIVLVGDEQTATYQNVYSARSLGVEAAAGWTSKREYVALDGNVTYVDFRNTSTKGAFAENEGDRIPNRPYLFGNGSARLQTKNVVATRDQLSLAWTTRYVHGFLRGWEGIGTNKLGVDAQLLHSLALIYEVRNEARALSFTGEVQNLTDQAAYDFYGVLRPGRAFYFKATASL